MKDNKHHESIQRALAAFQSKPLKAAATALLGTLGYRSDRVLATKDSSPAGFLSLFGADGSDTPFNREKALVAEWKSADLLFQLTDEELSQQASLFSDTEVRRSLLKSYVFIAIELRGTDYARGKFAAITRQINRLFPMPVMVLFKHHGKLTIAVINRRVNKRDEAKDVLGKVTVIREIIYTEPHRGHLDILASLVFSDLVHPDKLPITNFDTLHAAWEQIFNVDLLNERFYRELSDWYFWALDQVEFPADLEPDAEKRRATGLIRLLTRLIFCWFIKEKGLIPDKLFHTADLKNILKDFRPEDATNSDYYHAILQNLFFATLNQRMGKDAKGAPWRSFAPDGNLFENSSTYDINNLFRYQKLFRDPETAISHFEDIPFLNGGLFECLDRSDEKTKKKLYLDGFSRTAKNRPRIPNKLFFGPEEIVDLSEVFGDKKRKKEKVRGLIHILNAYKFTIVENTPIDQEIALDPELLGKVFENLLASYNEETKTTARKETGSFYTKRSIVDYMVDQCIRKHLAEALVKRAGMKETDAVEGLDILLAYTERDHAFSDREVDCLVSAIDKLLIIDPACGSGAYPMGVLHKLVFLLSKLDPGNARWKKTQLTKLDSPTMREKLERDFADNDDDYGRKLYLIENCLYGVDIQPIAIQISKLRFFVSLVCDQKTNRNKRENHGITPLPNLETKFVAADSLIKLPKTTDDLFDDPRIEEIEEELETLYHSHFSVTRRQDKIALQDKIKALNVEREQLLRSGMDSREFDGSVSYFWDPFDPEAKAQFFDPHWMFGRRVAKGFDIVIGNPPYVQIQKFPKAQKDLWIKQDYETYEATGDIYCLFYERGTQLLRPGGHLCYITSNKWMRAGYGEALRNYLANRVTTTTVLDFGMAQNFGAATTYTCVVCFQNTAQDNHKRRATLSCYATDTAAAMADPASYFERHAVRSKKFDRYPWVVMSPERARIKAMVEVQGTPLEKWSIQIFRGVLTGFNDAFYITQDQRDAFVAEDPKCADYLVPLLRGRYVERYRTNWDGTWMIATFPTLKLSFPELPRPIREHLEQYRPSLEPKPPGWSGKKWDGRKAGSYEWFETQDVIAYHREFSKPKIIYPNMTKYLPFCYDPEGRFFCNQKCFIITSEDESLPSLLAMLNSSVFKCCFRDSFPELLGNTYELSKIFVDKIPIKRPRDREAKIFEVLVPLVQASKAPGTRSTPGDYLEDLIDACVMECYFRDHMAERDLLFIDPLAPHLEKFAPKATPEQQVAFAEQLYKTLNEPKHPIRNRLLRLTADSPDLLAVIKAEGRT